MPLYTLPCDSHRSPQNNLPMAENANFLSTMINYCKKDGEYQRNAINILAKIAAGSLVTAKYLLDRPENVLEVMMDVVKSAGTDLKKWKKGNSNEFWALTFLQNMSLSPNAGPHMLRAGAFELIEPFVSQSSKESLQAGIACVCLMNSDKAKTDQIKMLLSQNTQTLDRVVELLDNTLNRRGDEKGANGNNTEYGYGVFPLRIPLRTVHALALAGGFEEYLIQGSGAFGFLHRAFSDWVEKKEGGYAGGGKDDPKSAMIALDTLVLLAKAATNKEDLLTHYSAPGITPLHELCEKVSPSPGCVAKRCRDVEERNIIMPNSLCSSPLCPSRAQV